MNRTLVRSWQPGDGDTGDSVWMVTADQDCPRCFGCGLIASTAIAAREVLLGYSEAYGARCSGAADLPDCGVTICRCVDVELKTVR